MGILALALVFGLGAASVSDERSASAATTDAALMLPETYEQYLPLTSPSDIAFAENKIAVSDGASIYLYDKTVGVWRCFRHTTEVSRIQFTDSGDLYFSDTALEFYRLKSDLTAEKQPYPLSTFYIVGGFVYAASNSNNTTALRKIPLGVKDVDLGSYVPFGQLAGKPFLSYANGILYCYCAQDNRIHRYDTSTESMADNSLLSSAVLAGFSGLLSFGGELYFSSNGAGMNGLYRFLVSDSSASYEQLLVAEGVTALTSFGGIVYAVEGNTVRAIRAEAGENGPALSYTGYEIGASSDSPNRLSGATESAYAGNVVVTADSGNNRVTVFDVRSFTYSVIDCKDAEGKPFTPMHISTDGATIAVSSGARIYTCAVGESGFRFATEASTTVNGLATIYGQTYFIATNMAFGMLGREDLVVHEIGTPTAIAADAYGTLYVAFENRKVYSFTEEEFLTPQAMGKERLTLPAGYRSLRSDYDGNLYYLLGNGLYSEGTEIAELDSRAFVYRGEGAGAVEPLSAAIGFEEGTVYFNFGDFMLKSASIGIPTLSTISTENAREELFSLKEEPSAVKIPAGSVKIAVDAGNVTETYAYLSHSRTDEPLGGILLAESGKFSLVAVYDNYSYSAALFLTSALQPVSPEKKETSKWMYLSNDVELTYAPCIMGELSRGPLARGARARVLTEYAAEDFGYAFSLVETEIGGETVRGYVPSGFLGSVSPIPSDPGSYRLGYLKESDGVLFRSETGEELTVKERLYAELFAQKDGAYLARFTRNGITYEAVVAADMIELGQTDALRISLIIILSVLAVGVLAAYLFLISGKRKK